MTTNILILCTHNSARSVLAEGMLNHWARRYDKDVHAFSAGSSPSGRINPMAFEKTRQSISDRMMRLVELPFGSLGDADLARALGEIGRN